MANHLRLVPDDNSAGEGDPWNVVLDDDFDDDDFDEVDLPWDSGSIRFSGWEPQPQSPTAKAGFARRLALLQAMSAEQIGDVLTRQPLAAAGLVGFGPLASYTRLGQAATGTKDREAIATYMGQSTNVDAAIAGLGPIAHNLVHIAAFYGGSLTFEQALAESDGVDHTTLRTAAGEIAGHLLSDPDGDFVTLLADIAAIVRPPGIPVRTFYIGTGTTNDELAFMLSNLQILPVKTTRAVLLDALDTALSDRNLMMATLQRLGPRHTELFNQIARQPFGISLKETDTGWFMANHYRSKQYANRGGYRPPNTPVHDLFDHGLIHVDAYSQHAWAWLEVRRALTGRLLADWPAPPDITPVAIDDTPYVGSVVGMVQGMLDLWTQEPAPGVKTGGLAVRSGRAAAKHLGFNQDDGPTLGRIAIALGLLREQMVTTGKGRKMETTYQYTAGEAARLWGADSYVQRWVDIVVNWTTGYGAAPNDMGAAGHLHRVVLGDLTQLPVGTGIPESRFAEWAADRRHQSFGVRAPYAQVLHDLRMLGLVPPSGAVGLTTLARAIVSNPTAAQALMPAPATTFVVQPDHSILAPNDLDPDIAARLDRLAEQISVGSARMLRLDAARIGRETAASAGGRAGAATGSTADEILEFLETHSSVPVPAVVKRFVIDAASAADGMIVATATSLVICEDARSMQRALGVRAAKLTMIAPTVATSTLAADKLVAALRAKGLHPTTGAKDSADGAQIVAMPQSSVGKQLVAAAGTGTGRPLPRTVQPDAAQLVAILGLDAQ